VSELLEQAAKSAPKGKSQATRSRSVRSILEFYRDSRLCAPFLSAKSDT
jgi:hypothetical protein